MFDDVKYMRGDGHYFVNGIVEHNTDSRVIWWETCQYKNGKPIKKPALEHSAVEILQGIYLDAEGIFCGAEGRREWFKDLSTSATGTMEQFKKYIKGIGLRYGNRKEKGYVEKVLKEYKPIVLLGVKTGVKLYTVEQWSRQSNMISLREVDFSAVGNSYVYVQKVNLTLSLDKFLQHFREGVGWRHIYEL